MNTPMTRLLPALLFALATISSGPAAGAEADGQAPGAAAITASDFSAPDTWGAAKNVVGIRHLFLSGQPDSESFAAAAEHGVGVVINLRYPDEQDWDEAAAAAAAGLDYYNLPVSRSGPGFDDETLARISAVVGEHRDTKILMHCSTGNRAAAWLAYHLVRDHGMPVEESIELSQLAGLTNAGMQTRVRDYLAPQGGE